MNRDRPEPLYQGRENPKAEKTENSKAEKWEYSFWRKAGKGTDNPETKQKQWEYVAAKRVMKVLKGKNSRADEGSGIVPVAEGVEIKRIG